MGHGITLPQRLYSGTFIIQMIQCLSACTWGLVLLLLTGPLMLAITD